MTGLSGNEARVGAAARLGARLLAHVRFIALFSLAFFPAYGLGLWRGSTADAPLVLAFIWERDWPFAPGMIAAYLSLFLAYGAPLLTMPVERYPALTRQTMLAALICGAVFLLLPTTSGFAPHPPLPEIWQPAFAFLHMIDRPFNLFPSLHVAGATLVLLAAAEQAPRALGWALRGWLALIALSTLFVHQHHLADLAAGLALALWIRRRWPLCAAR